MIKKDSQITGFISGVIGPFIGGFIYYLLQFSSMTFEEYISTIISSGSLSAVISLSVIFNLAVFFLFIWTNLNLSARGVILATFLYVLVVVLIKFIE